MALLVPAGVHSKKTTSRPPWMYNTGAPFCNQTPQNLVTHTGPGVSGQRVTTNKTWVYGPFIVPQLAVMVLVVQADTSQGEQKKTPKAFAELKPAANYTVLSGPTDVKSACACGKSSDV